ncbi:DUF1289 domain-containing protein [Jannaschia sp. Os4]|uniref:DUF1289 domain-containing protein n=1 Tax=Jannaschia sp. Os4 TaxID=2807617 RepID=UPI0019396705|nr:DUF1289 domain-containing protein [Jannaschia sp. Os4]MBM2576466.1 DUF1289 domain-containing protein [Jannaschia sp. Os4]
MTVWTRDEIDSPCIRVCVVHPASRLCTGCLRTMDEIAAWTRMTPDARRAVMAQLPGRGAAHKVRRGGRAARLEQRAAQHVEGDQE